MKNVYIYPYKMGSRSAAALASVLNVSQIKHKGSKFKGSERKTVINWGASEVSNEVVHSKRLNKCPDVVRAGNKLAFFFQITQKIKGTSVMAEMSRFVPWSEDSTVAQSWLNKGHTVVCRKILTGHSGSGILIVEPGSELPKTPLYTQYVPKDSEYRIHCFKFGNNHEIVFSQRKIKNPEVSEPKTWKVRSHDNGFVFQHHNSDGTFPLKVPEDVKKQALLVFQASGLDFGAVDVIFNRKQDKGYILEINCAPGLIGLTLETYANAFKKMLNLEKE